MSQCFGHHCQSVSFGAEMPDYNMGINRIQLQPSHCVNPAAERENARLKAGGKEQDKKLCLLFFCKY